MIQHLALLGTSLGASLSVEVGSTVAGVALFVLGCVVLIGSVSAAVGEGVGGGCEACDLPRKCDDFEKSKN